MRVFFEVSLDLPSGATKADVREYILTEVMAGCGCRHPEDPMFDLDRTSVSVKGLKMPPKVTA